MGSGMKYLIWKKICISLQCSESLSEAWLENLDYTRTICTTTSGSDSSIHCWALSWLNGWLAFQLMSHSARKDFLLEVRSLWDIKQNTIVLSKLATEFLQQVALSDEPLVLLFLFYSFLMAWTCGMLEVVRAQIFPRISLNFKNGFQLCKAIQKTLSSFLLSSFVTGVFRAENDLRQDQGQKYRAIDFLVQSKCQVGCNWQLCDVNSAHCDPFGSVNSKGHWQRLQAHWSVVKGQLLEFQTSTKEGIPPQKSRLAAVLTFVVFFTFICLQELRQKKD